MINTEYQELLLDLARRSIDNGLQHGVPLRVVDHATLPAALLTPAATFVTLHTHGQLRGCIGSLVADRPLIDSIATNAFKAAFKDPRFAPLRRDEFPAVALHISILGEANPIHCDSEADLLAQLQPGVDGIVLDDGRHRATFLPSVWQQLAAPLDFVRQLKRKAGLPADYWRDDLHFRRYAVQEFGDCL